MKQRIVTAGELKSFVNGFRDDFTAVFMRKNPKCLSCGKSNPKWRGMKECPKCGSRLSLNRRVNGTLDFEKVPKSETPKKQSPTGGFKERLQKNWLTYYDFDVKPNAFRSFYLDSVVVFVTKDTEFEVVKDDSDKQD